MKTLKEKSSVFSIYKANWNQEKQHFEVLNWPFSIFYRSNINSFQHNWSIDRLLQRSLWTNMFRAPDGGQANGFHTNIYCALCILFDCLSEQFWSKQMEVVSNLGDSYFWLLLLHNIIQNIPFDYYRSSGRMGQGTALQLFSAEKRLIPSFQMDHNVAQYLLNVQIRNLPQHFFNINLKDHTSNMFLELVSASTKMQKASCWFHIKLMRWE